MCAVLEKILPAIQNHLLRGEILILAIREQGMLEFSFSLQSPRKKEEKKKRGTPQKNPCITEQRKRKSSNQHHFPFSTTETASSHYQLTLFAPSHHASHSTQI